MGDLLTDVLADPNEETVADATLVTENPVEGQDTKLPAEVKTEEDIEKMDLTVPEHITEFRSYYQQKKDELRASLETNEVLQQELDTMRANAGQGVYIDINQPLDDFNPKESLQKMKEEDTPYYERVKEAVLETEFWPAVSEQFRSYESKILDPQHPEEGRVLNEMLGAWDTMSKKMYQLGGDATYMILDTVLRNPDLVAEVNSRANGQSAYNPETPFVGNGTATYQAGYAANGNGQYAPPPTIQTIEQVARDYELDPLNASQKRLIDNIINEQRGKVATHNAQVQQAQQFQQREMILKQENEKLKRDQETKQTMSQQEAEKRAESNVNTLISDALDKEIALNYSGQIPKDKPQLLGKLKTLTETRLERDPNYQKARSAAKSWFKQAAAATRIEDQAKWQQKGINAIASMVPIRKAAMETEAVELIGPVKQRAVKKSTTPAPAPRREIDGGSIAPPAKETPQIKVGDMYSAKERIKQRARQSGHLTG